MPWKSQLWVDLNIPIYWNLMPWKILISILNISTSSMSLAQSMKQLQICLSKTENLDWTTASAQLIKSLSLSLSLSRPLLITYKAFTKILKFNTNKKHVFRLLRTCSFFTSFFMPFEMLCEFPVYANCTPSFVRHLSIYFLMFLKLTYMVLNPLLNFVNYCL